MAFQAGTRVDPRLMQADYSGFTNAAQIRADSASQLGQNIGNAISSYKDKKKEDKQFAQGVKNSIALIDALMVNLPEDQSEKLAIYARDSGLIDSSTPMSERYQASQDIKANISAIMNSIEGPPEVTSQSVPGGTVIMENGKVVDVIESGPSFNFGGTPPVIGGQVAADTLSPADVQAEMAALQNKQ